MRYSSAFGYEFENRLASIADLSFFLMMEDDFD
jgi:hypothetical protein